GAGTDGDRRRRTGSGIEAGPSGREVSSYSAFKQKHSVPRCAFCFYAAVGRYSTAVNSTTTLQKSSHPPKRPEHAVRMFGKIAGNHTALIVSRSIPGATRAIAPIARCP